MKARRWTIGLFVVLFLIELHRFLRETALWPGAGSADTRGRPSDIAVDGVILVLIGAVVALNVVRARQSNAQGDGKSAG